MAIYLLNHNFTPWVLFRLYPDALKSIEINNLL